MKITSSQLAYEYLKHKITHPVEEFWVLGLKSNKTLIRAECLFKGTVDACLIHPRDVYRFGCLANASSLIVAHNHPSGDPMPSTSDLWLTKNLRAASEILQIPLLDHLILTDESYVSLADWGYFTEPPALLRGFDTE